MWPTGVKAFRGAEIQEVMGLSGKPTRGGESTRGGTGLGKDEKIIKSCVAQRSQV